MKIKSLLHKLAIILTASAFGSGVVGCTDDNTPFDTPDFTVSGAPVTVKVKVHVPEMDVKSRANLSNTQMNTVRNLWVRTYSALSGKSTSNWKEVTDFPTVQNPGSENSVDVEINTLSGSTYIVAVANVDNNGVLRSNPTESKPLRELLSAADTWEEFLDIAVPIPTNSDNIYAPQTYNVNGMPMSGCYTDIVEIGHSPSSDGQKIAPAYNRWESLNFESHFIPASNSVYTLSNGAIHMRRLHSHIFFNVKPVNSDISVKVNSYTVYNAPRYSWLYERTSNRRGGANFGDGSTDVAERANYWTTTLPFATQYIDDDKETNPGDNGSFTEVDSKGSSTFDFWQVENKHTGTSQSYTAREVSTGTDPVLFTSLTGNTWTPNNMASYVRLRCTIDYNGKTLQVNDNGEVVNSGGQVVYRIGYADYIIHLGYMNQNATDFSSYRNVNYFYNVTVNGVDDIRVDAFADAAPYPGEEGIVTDLTEEHIDLDAHYNAFNIQLTASDLDLTDSGNTGFGYLIATYRNGTQYTFDETTELSPTDSVLYNWIELKPTTGQTVLATYTPANPYVSGATNNSETFFLTDLNAKLKDSDLEPGWYTVFVGEYAYEKRWHEGASTNSDGTYDQGYGDESQHNWKYYVNQDPRRFYIKTTQKKSPSGNQIYARSKYGISQYSIETYYNLTDPNRMAEEIVGIERFNETEGLCLRSSFANENADDQNGRYNAALWLSGNTANGTDITITNDDVNSRPEWSTFINAISPLAVNAVTGNRAQGGPEILAHTAQMPAIVTLTGQTSVYNDPTSNGPYIEAMNACMNRNRDNNGNKRIDPEEIRWFTPTIGQYLRVLLGTSSLEEPLMDYESVTQLQKVSNKNSWNNNGTMAMDYQTRYMFGASNTMYTGTVSMAVMWAMEGMSTSSWDKAHEWGGGYPWGTRCIRNLGTNLKTISQNIKTTIAYQKVEGRNVVEMTYFDSESIRTEKWYGNGTGENQMPVHLANNTKYNKVYRAFEYKTENLSNTTGTTIENMQTYIYTNPCSVYGDDWRLPNQKEAAIMRNLGLLDNLISYDDDTANAQFLATCTACYFNSSTGIGGTYTNGQNYFLGFCKERGLLMTTQNYGYYQHRITRCVRDVDL